MAVNYDPNMDYKKAIKEAVENDDFEKAAQLEEQRNAKITGLNNNGTNQRNAQPSYNYTSETGVSGSINDQIWGQGGSGQPDHQDVIGKEKQHSTGSNPNTDAEMEEQAQAWGIDIPSLYRYSQHGGYVQDGGTGQLPGTGEEGWSYVSGQQRPVANGASGADEHFLSDGAYEMIQYCKKQYANATTQEEKDYWHEQAERIRARAGYSGGSDGSMYIPLAQVGVTPVDPDVRENLWNEIVPPSEPSEPTMPPSGSTMPPSGSVGGGSDPQKPGVVRPVVKPTTPPKPDPLPEPEPDPEPDPLPEPEPVPQPNYRELMDHLKELLDQWQEAAVIQSDSRINQAVGEAVTALQQAMEDAEPQFKEQVEAIARDERQAMDNSALYAQLRGDQGGIGQSQYNAIQNAAARNRLAVHEAQTRLATDTGRQITALRAEGEFEKADAALAVTQQYLEKLVGLEQWAAEFGVDVSAFQAELQQWEKEYQLALQKLQISQKQWAEEMELKRDELAFENNRWQVENGLKQGPQAWENNRWQQAFEHEMMAQGERNQLAQMGNALLEAGIMPNEGQLAAMGITAEQATQSIIILQMKEAEG